MLTQANDQRVTDQPSKGGKIDFPTSQFGLSQIIKEPTHILHNSSSCIDLIFITQPNMVLESGVHYSLHQNCDHQIIFAKFNLKVLPSSLRKSNFSLLPRKC